MAFVMGARMNIKMKKQMNKAGPQPPRRELIHPPRSKAGLVTIAPAGMYVLGKEAPNVYCCEPEAPGLDQVYMTRPSASRLVCGSDGKPDGALCQRGSSGLTPGGRWKLTVKSVLPTTYWLPNQGGEKTAEA